MAINSAWHTSFCACFSQQVLQAMPKEALNRMDARLLRLARMFVWCSALDTAAGPPPLRHLRHIRSSQRERYGCRLHHSNDKPGPS